VLFAAIALILLPTGIAVVAGIFVVKSDSAAKIDRIGQKGIVVEALLTNYRHGRRLSSTVWLQYEYAGSVLRVQVECDKRKLCDPRYSRTMPVTIDPAAPRELVTVLGVTDNSTRFLDNWGLLIGASVMLGFGGLSAYLWWVLGRQARVENSSSRPRRPLL
jgi:hypothetical protein